MTLTPDLEQVGNYNNGVVFKHISLKCYRNVLEQVVRNSNRTFLEHFRSITVSSNAIQMFLTCSRADFSLF